MKLKWHQYVLGSFQIIALVYKCGGLKKAGLYMEEESDRLEKKNEMMITDLKSQLEEMVELAITRRFKEMQVQASEQMTDFLLAKAENNMEE